MGDIYFGIGSFHFNCIKEIPDISELYKNYVKEITRILGTCSSINNIFVSDNNIFKISNKQNMLYYNELEVNSNDSVYSSSNGISPQPSFLRIEFDLFIPYRVQKELNRKPISIQTNTENFKVYIIYDNYFPVAIVGRPKGIHSGSRCGVGSIKKRRGLRNDDGNKGGIQGAAGNG
ncbi:MULTISPECIES: hypothetical protein [Paenibacillus]|uniref:Uncharacterized protein n=1 Tax=Paenibacillus albilobatus TaxID=2716884 RepID=A0A919XH98_9BACL|nr:MULTISPECIES: hypothetical protein [Paenibacillus]GIO30772.1 hypothetical protein J2TS6_19130 [Paenibacillus albilobatus]